MKYKSLLMGVALTALACFIFQSEALARGGRGGGGGGGRGGGGGGRGGGAGGGASRSSQSRQMSGPYGGGGSSSSSRQNFMGPSGSSASRGHGSGSYTTSKGGTVDYAGAGGRASGPGGGTAARGVGGVQVDTAGGQSYTKVGRAGGAVGPGGNAVAGRSSVDMASGARGTVAGASRGGAALGPGGAVASGSRAGVAVGADGGAVAGGSRAGVAVGADGGALTGGAAAGGSRWGAASAGPYGLAGGAASGAAIAHRTQFTPSGALAAQGANVRQNFSHGNCFTPDWFAGHNNAWHPAAWAAGGAWAGASWGAVSAACGYAQPIPYDYGSSVVYQGDQVYNQGEPVATAEDYAEQATQIAAQGQAAQPADDEEWTPLGVFGLVKGETKDADNIFQLAIDQQGNLRGNYYNAVSDSTSPVTGSVDNQSQRAAWTVEGQQNTVFETGIANLTQPETTVLVHHGKDHTQHWTLVRMDSHAEQP